MNVYGRLEGGHWLGIKRNASESYYENFTRPENESKWAETYYGDSAPDGSEVIFFMSDDDWRDSSGSSFLRYDYEGW